MIKHIRTPLLIALATLLLVLGLASCGNGSDDTASSGADTAEVSSTEVATTEPVADDATVEASAEDDTGEDDEHGDNNDDHQDADHDHDEVQGVADAHSGTGLNVDLFLDGALLEPATAACTLADGSSASCHQLTIVGSPVDEEIGPFCPTTTSDTADDAGIWLDGSSIYDLDGQFILDLAEIYGDDTWQLYNEDGTVRVTDTVEAFEGAARPDVDPEYQNYCVEGRIEWLDGGQPVTSSVEIPTVPVASGSATQINGSVGVTLNGVIIDGSAPVAAILGAYTIAAFDDCGGHVNPVAGYHMHGATGCSEVGDAADGDTPIFGYALDGYAIHSPLAGADLDECNGHTTNESGYHYHASPAEENAVLTCFMGLTAGAATDGGRGGDRPAGPPPGDAPAPADEPAPAEDQGTDEGASTAAGTPVDTLLAGVPTEYAESYSLVDEDFGTMVTVTVADGTRTIVSNSLPDHNTGDFPNSGNPNTISEQSLVLEYPANPVYVGNAGFAQQPGMAVNGVAFEPGTAETVTCESGETYRIEGLQDQYNLGMDFNNAHVQPTGQYHYHGVAQLLVDNYDAGTDLVHVGFAADGFLIYYSSSGAYASSYELAPEARVGSDCVASGPAGGTTIEIEGTTPDGTYNTDWEFVDSAGDLDSCNGIEIGGVYAYVLTDEYPFVPRCLNGEFTATGPGAGGASDGAPDFAGAAATLGVTEEELLAALGGPPPDFAAAAEILGVTEEELEAVLPAPPGR